jgi:hypothetical protein
MPINVPQIKLRRTNECYNTMPQIALRWVTPNSIGKATFTPNSIGKATFTPNSIGKATFTPKLFWEGYHKRIRKKNPLYTLRLKKEIPAHLIETVPMCSLTRLISC